MENVRGLPTKQWFKSFHLLCLWGAMGYKLAGCDVIGCNEIDPRMNKVYVENHRPKYNYLEKLKRRWKDGE